MPPCAGHSAAGTTQNCMNLLLARPDISGLFSCLAGHMVYPITYLSKSAQVYVHYM